MAESQGGQREGAKKYAQLVAKTWLDPEFRQRLTANPVEVLREERFDVPAGGARVTMMEGTESMWRAGDVLCINLPAKPASLEEGELTDEQLTDIGAATPRTRSATRTRTRTATRTVTLPGQRLP